MQAGFVLDALVRALHDRRQIQGDSLIHHGDRGARHVSIKHAERLADAGIAPCVGSVGDGCNDALAATATGLFKTEAIRRRGPRRSLEAVEFAALERVDGFDNHRLPDPIGNVPPAEAEARLCARSDEFAMVA